MVIGKVRDQFHLLLKDKTILMDPGPLTSAGWDLSIWL